MAYYKITTDKNGTLKAKIQIYHKDISGKNVLCTKTVYNTDGLSETKFKRLVEKQSVDFQIELDKKLKEDLDKARQQKLEQEEANRILTFPELMDEWAETVRANLSINYYAHAKETAERFYPFLKEHGLYNKPLSEIRVRDIQLFLNQLAAPKIVNTGVSELIRTLPSYVSFRKLADEKILPRSTSYYMNNYYARIATKTAKRLCNYYNLDFNTYFKEIIEAKQYSVETIKNHRRTLRTVFNEAVRYEWITTNPVSKTKVGAGAGNTSLRPINEKEIFSIREMKEFLHALDELPYELMNKKVMIKLMLLTGVRTAELHGLKWCDINLDKQVVCIRRNRLYSNIIGTYEKVPKTKTSVRDIPIPKDLLKDLIAYKDWFRIADSDFDNKLDQYYLAVNEYREPENTHSIGHWLAKFEEQKGFRHISPHGLRHTYCSMLLSQNVPIQTVSKYMGHSDSAVTLEVYSHFIPDTQEKVYNAINTILGDDD